MTQWYAASVLGLPVYVILWLFLIYAFAGVLVEGVFCLVLTGRLELRLGLLYLPLRPIYGVGGAACTLFLSPLLAHPLVVFTLSVIICSAVEFAAGWAVDRAFHTISWDYSDKRLNLRGRICLQYSLCWGLLATAALYGCHALVVHAAEPPGPRAGETLLTVLIILTMLSGVLTLATLARVRRRLAASGAQGDLTTGSTSRVDRLIDQLVPDPVIVHSFPRMGLSEELRQLTQGAAPAHVAARQGTRQQPA